jgi:hypothetical protein
MTAAPRPIRHAHGGRRRQSRTAPALQKKVGCPTGPPSTLVNLRIPLALLAQLDRSSDRLEGQPGLKAHRGMLARRAVELFLETRSPGRSALAL